MNKNDLSHKLAEQKKVSVKQANEMIDSVTGVISIALSEKSNIQLIGFGTFKVEERKARKGRNPQTGAEINIPAKSAPKFVAGKALKEAVSGIKTEVKPKAETKIPSKSKVKASKKVAVN